MSSPTPVPQTPNGKQPAQVATTRRVFKDASELPRSKPDYVVMSPTPLGFRPVPPANPHSKSR
jgi:hypothetical protein